jgi:O-succinylbenzoic acid--CoA ligase
MLNDGTGGTFPNWLVEQVKTRPQGLAVGAGSEELNFEGLYNRALGLASRLRAGGVGKNSRVAALLGNGLPFVELIHALMQVEAVLVPLNLRLAPSELAWQLKDVGADYLLTDNKRLEQAEAARAGLAAVRLINLDDLAALPDPPEGVNPPATYQAGELHTIIYSSGTTGQPKGVRLTYGNHYFNALASYRNFPAGPEDSWLAVLPLFHVGGLAIILRGLFYGMPVLVHESFDPAAVNRAIDREGVRIISVVSNMLARMLDQRQDKPYPASLRSILIGGGPVPPPLLERCARSGIPVVQTYGLTETASQAVTLAAQDALRKLGSAGRPLPGVELKINPESDGAGAGPAVSGLAGEILRRGGNFTPGYEGRPAETARAWRDGWFHTGDIGRLDKEGYLYVLDRRNDLIISGGENVYPAEVEAVLLAHPQVEEAGVIGQPDEKWGQVVVAFVKARSGIALTEDELLAYCRERLARYKLPRAVYFVAESLPRNATGKLLRRSLREILAGFKSDQA